MTVTTSGAGRSQGCRSRAQDGEPRRVRSLSDESFAMIPSSGRGRSAALLLCLAAIASAAPADEIDRYVAQEQSVYGVPAIVVGVYRDGELVDERAIGLSNVELGVVATPKHAFEIGSISKQFTAWAILMLRDEGRLDLDAPVGRYLPDLPPAWAAPSLHRLLTHSSGLPDLEDAFTYGVYRETPSDADFLRRLVALPIDFAPGEKWAYSNTNYWLLARVIETLSGLSYADFMQQRVFTPLGMTSTRSALPALPMPNRASGYEQRPGNLENRDAIRPNTGRGLGDIVTTVADMAHWEREQRSPRLVTADSVMRARTPVVLNDGTTEPYGYGWQIGSLLGQPTLSHAGQTAGFTSICLRVPDRRLAVVVLTNLYGAPIASLGETVAAAVEPVLKRPPRVAVTTTDAVLAARVRELLDTGASAETAWQADWFTDARWKSIRDSLADRAVLYRRLGPVLGLTPVSADATDRPGDMSYRVRYGSVTRIFTVGVDDEGRIARTMTLDE